MKPARIAVLGIAIVAGGVAMLLVRRPGETQVIVKESPAQQVTINTAEVLTTAGDLPLGHVVTAGDLRWQHWPTLAINPLMIQKGDAETQIKDFTGAIVRSAFLANEPLRSDKVIKGAGGGFMSAVLPSGKRAVAITTDTQGQNTAGGFILPNDRVDVIRTYRDDEATKATGSEVQVSETILTNIRILAIGQNVQEQGGTKVVTGQTATLELDPKQVETVALAQRVGQLTLALRSIVDANRTSETLSDRDGSVTVIRFGVSQQSTKK